MLEQIAIPDSVHCRASWAGPQIGQLLLANSVHPLLRTAPTPETRPGDSAELNRGRSLLGIGIGKDADKSGALSDNDEAVEYYQSGVDFADMGDYRRAIQEYDQAIALDPEFHGAYLNRGNIYLRFGDYQSAIRDYSRAIEIDPDAPGAYDNRGNAYAALGQYDRALRDHTQAIEVDPRFAAAYDNRGTTYMDIGEHEKAIRDYDRAIELDDTYAGVHYNRGNAHVGLEAIRTGHTGLRPGHRP